MEEHILMKWLTDRVIADFLLYKLNFFTGEYSRNKDRKMSYIN